MFSRLRHRLFLRYALAVGLMAVTIAVALALALRVGVRGAFAGAAGLAVFLLLLGAVTAWNRRTLDAGLRELGGALQGIVEGDAESMPCTRLSELDELANDMEAVADRVRGNYRELTAQRDWLEAVLENINAGVIVISRKLKIEMINPAAERILGTTREYALGRTFTEVHHTSVIDRAIEKSRRGASVTREVKISLPSRRVLRVLSNPIRDKKGRTTGVICVLDDVTARRRLERVRRDFVANVSHELRTPVTNVRAVVEALVAGAREDPDACARFISDLDRESVRLVNLIEDLLMLSRSETEGAGMVAEHFVLEELLAEVVAEKQPLADRHRVALRFTGGGGATAVKADVNILKAAVGNLLDNAIKYNGPGGSVEVTLRHGESDVTVEVRDTGIGIPPDDLDKIFERFYRVDKARSRETGGTGLGLSIVKHAAESHGGTVSVTSTEGEGSTFSLALPLEASPRGQEAAPGAGAGPGQGPGRGPGCEL